MSKTFFHGGRKTWQVGLRPRGYGPGHDVRKDRLVHAHSASFNTITGQMTERSQGKNRFLHCSVKKLMNHSVLQPHLVRSEASHTFLKIKQQLCANLPKGLFKNCFRAPFWELASGPEILISTSVCEAGFSALSTLKQTSRNRLLNVENDMSLALTNTFPRISNLVAKMQAQSSHWLAYVLFFCIRI